VDFLLSQNNLILLIIAVISGLMLLFPSVYRARGVRELSATEAVQLINRKDARLIDIRNPERFKAQHITQSRNIPVADINQQITNWAKETPIILVCDTGRTTLRPAAELRKLGFTEVYSLQGGINSWRQAGLPTTESK